MNTGKAIIDGIVSGGLMHARCLHDENHRCLVTWSGGAAEQLEALITDNQTMNAELHALEQELAAEAAISDLEVCCESEEHSGKHYGRWYRLNSVMSTSDGVRIVNRAVRYLELRKLLKRHPENARLVRPVKS